MPKGSNSRAASLLKKVDKELQSIPQYTGESVYGTDTRSAYNFGEATKNAITGLRRGIRILSGKQSKPSLLAKREKLQGLISEVQELKSSKEFKGRMK
jgi:hypothetical protein